MSVTTQLLFNVLCSSQTCFRTCFDDNDECEVTKSSVENQMIELDAGGNDQLYTQRKVFSPEYSIDPEYSGSTMCR